MAIKHIMIGSTTHDVNDARNVVIGDGVNNIVKCTLAQYNALATKDANTVYIPTDAPAVPSGGGSSDNIFVAEYGTTTHAEIVTAINASKIVCVKQPSGADEIMLLYSGGLTSFPDDLIFTQVAIDGSYARGFATWATVTSSDVWSSGMRQLLSDSSVATSVSSSSTDSKVPSAKCLYTALQTKQNTINASNKLSYSYISGTPTELPASDVYAWAKASTKPTYTASEVGALPDTTSIPTESTVSGWGFTKNTGTYSKPSGGIPATDLASAVQTSLGKADTALQSYTETDPVFTASAAHGISSTDISNWNAKQKAITISSSEPTSSQGSNGDIWIVI